MAQAKNNRNNGVEKLEKAEVGHDEVRPTLSQEPQTRAPQARSDARERIMEAALKLFATRGFDATPTKEIAWEAGVPGGLVFYYFPTKRSLLLAIIDQAGLLPELKEVIQNLLASPSQGDPRVELTEVGVRLMEHFANTQTLMRVVVNEFLTNPDLMGHVRTLYEESVKMIRDYLEAQMRLGKLRQADLDVLVRIFVGAIGLGALERRSDIHEYMKTTVDLLLDGLVVESKL